MTKNYDLLSASFLVARISLILGQNESLYLVMCLISLLPDFALHWCTVRLHWNCDLLFV